MAQSLFGESLDIHMGGIDLRFPHHDNELAQSEACNNHNHFNQWTNYFIHFGHLNIDGLKMSKSLKNFLTIKELLIKYNARQIRLYVAKHKYNTLMDFDMDKSMSDVIEIDKKNQEFFLTIKAIIRGYSVFNINQKWN